jgi:hypothetical protein
MIISTKAGYYMWPGPYGDFGSRKYLLSSLDQSLKRMNMDYVDIFYHHRMDPETPLEETMTALADIVRSGKALYVGLSNYDGETMKKAAKLLDELHCPFVINQNRYPIFDRHVEKNGILDACISEGKGMIVFSPLAQGLLTNKYIHGIPEGSRATRSRFLSAANITEEVINKCEAAPGKLYLETTEKMHSQIETRRYYCTEAWHEPSDNDVMMFDWVVAAGFTPYIIATKSDKLKRSQIAKQTAMIRRTFKEKSRASHEVSFEVIPFSGLSKAGREDIYNILEGFLHKDEPMV